MTPSQSTDDLVKRLRALKGVRGHIGCGELFVEAADAIEKLGRSYEYGLLKKCFAVINPNTNPSLIREIAAYLAGPLPDEENAADTIERLQADLAARDKTIETLREDAERYRWLKANHLQLGPDCWIRTGDDLDDATDAARSEGGKP